MNLETIAMIASIIAVFVAIVALILETRGQRLALQSDLLLKLQDKFDSTQMRSWRIINARKLRKNEAPGLELEEILGFFSMMGFLVQRKALDHSLVYKEFSYWIVRYWRCAEGYVQEARRAHPAVWKSLEYIAKKYMKWEQKEGFTHSEKDLQAFILEETQLLPQEDHA